MKHTPGPWRLNAQGNTLRGERDHFVCDMNDVAPANARLIAAAPDLLEALKAICDELADDCDYDAKAIARYAGRNAIAKATGEAA